MLYWFVGFDKIAAKKINQIVTISRQTNTHFFNFKELPKVNKD